MLPLLLPHPRPCSGVLPRLVATFACGVVSLAAQGLSWAGNTGEWVGGWGQRRAQQGSCQKLLESGLACVTGRLPPRAASPPPPPPAVQPTGC